MPIATGTRIGPYEITGVLGAGGMGEVYRARDTKLQRDVAVKVLPEHLGADPERLARFEREAQLLAALVHPHIATIHGVEESNGSSFLILELLEGESLAQRLKAGALSVDDALAIARQIADAVHAAHRKGIIHRDLKPANVMVSPEGRVKVLDFGLAKSLEAGPYDTDSSPTFTSPAMTHAGVILGTAPYMAPEQAKGGVTDRRTDVWAFGCVVYEMLTGKRPFIGDDVTEIVAAVVRGEPDWSALPSSLPPVAGVYLRRCLQKNPNDRVQDIGDLKLALEGAFDVPVAAGREPGLTRKHFALAAAGALTLAAVAAAAAWILKPPADLTSEPLRRFAVIASPGPLTIANTNTDVAITPDGTRIIFMAGQGTNRTIYSRPLDSLTATPLRQVVRAFEPFVSPDSKWVAYNDESDYTLRKIPLDGGPPLVIARIRHEIFGASWGDDGSIVYADSLGLWRIPAGHAEPVELSKPDSSKGEVSHAWPQFLPGSTAIVYTVRHGARAEDATVAALDLKSRTSKLLLRGGTSPRYSSTGHLVYGVENTLRAVRFDADRLEVSGDPVPVVDGVITKASGCADFGLSRDGTLVFVSGAGGGTQKRLAWVDRDGARRPLKAPPRAYNVARISPDATQIAVETRDLESDIWIWDIAREQLRQLTTGPAFEGLPVWTGDSRRLLFASTRNGVLQVFRQAADGSGEPELLTPPGPAVLPMSITPDGKTALARQEGGGGGEDIMLLPLATGGKLVPLLATRFAESNADVSPDGRWIAYQSNESGGAVEVFVRPFPNVQDGRWQISSGGGFHPAWATGGAELFFVAADGRLLRVPVTTRGGFAAGPSSVAVPPPFYASNIPRSYDVTRDGKRLLIIEDLLDNRSSPDGINVVLNWAAELRKLLPR